MKPLNPEGNQPWIFTGRTDAEAEAPILWPPDGTSWLIGKDPDAGKDWRQVEKEAIEGLRMPAPRILEGSKWHETAWRCVVSPLIKWKVHPKAPEPWLVCRTAIAAASGLRSRPAPGLASRRGRETGSIASRPVIGRIIWTLLKASGERYVPEQGSQQPLLSLGMVGGPLKSKFPEVRLRTALQADVPQEGGRRPAPRICPAQWCGYILEKASLWH